MPSIAPVLLAVLAAPQVQGDAGQDGFVSQEPEFKLVLRELRHSNNPFFGAGQRRKIERILASGKARENKARLYRVSLARMLLKEGDIDEAIRRLEEVRASRPADWKNEVEFQFALGSTYLRAAESANCVAGHRPESCLFPLEGGAVHFERGPALKARRAFETLLEHQPENLETRWLLNLVAMALGDWPEAVPEAQRLPFEMRGEERSPLAMRDVAGDLGVDRLDLCGGVSVEDFDGDGWLDLLCSTYDPAGSMGYYRNRGDGTFEDLSDASHASDQFGGLNIVSADYDGDGDRDVLVLRGAWLQDQGQIRNSLLRNDGGSFVDVTRAAGLAEPARPTQTGVWGDFDGDGDLDLFVGNESRYESLPPREVPPENETEKERRKRLRREADERQGDYPSQLFMNQGDGTFVDEAAERGATVDRYCKGATAGDFDNDGDLDLYVSNIGANRLLRNDGTGRFEDVAEAAGVTEPVGRSFATWFFDYDNDGWLDLFVAAYDAGLADLAAEALGQEWTAAAPRLYRNRGDGTFEDVAEAVGLARPFKPMGANFGDLDGDGWLDIYLTTGEPQLMSLMPNVFLRNEGGARFVDETLARELGHLQKGHGVAFADLDHDGDADLYHQLGGFYGVDRYYNALFENPGHGNRWLYLELVGQGGLRDPIGARVSVELGTPSGPRTLHRAHGSVSSFGGSPARLEIGLGDATSIERVRVLWPGAEEPQGFEGLELDTRVRLTRGASEVERLPMEARRLGGE